MSLPSWLPCLFHGHDWQNSVAKWFPYRLTLRLLRPRGRTSGYRGNYEHVANIRRECRRCGKRQSGELVKWYPDDAWAKGLPRMVKQRDWR